MRAELLAAVVAAGVTPQSHDIYIWQRLWSPSVPQAVSAAKNLTSGWRVLAAETDPGGHLHSFAVNWKALQDRKVTAVVRIDGALGRFDHKTLLQELRRASAHWPKTVALEIDYDCGTARLSHYAVFLKALRQQHAAPLTITALPTWLSSPDLAALLDIPDQAILQVHAVLSPSRGLFDAQQARQWIDRFDGVTTKPFRIALPDYATRVIRGKDGAIIALESETPKLVGGTSAEELLAAPNDVAGLVRDLARKPPRHLAGLSWFRLPVAGDRRIWSLPTLARVMTGQATQRGAGVVTRSGAATGAVDVFLVNRSAYDVVLPQAVSVPSSCKIADGVGAYRFQGQKFRRLQNAFLPAQHEMVIGWARCGAGKFDVEP